jgi:hypothetical protein
VTHQPLDRLRTDASRGDYASMARLAKALYDRGFHPREVLRECYSVEFPAEFFVLAELPMGRTDLLMIFTNQPWKLALPPAAGETIMSPNELEEDERRIFDRDPDLVPLIYLLGAAPWWANPVLCYRLSELATGRTTVFSISRKARPQDEITPRGDSALSVLHERHTRLLESLEWEIRQPSNRGAGAAGLDEIANARSSLARIENMRRRAEG